MLAKKDFANAVKYNPDDYELYVGIYENLAGNSHRPRTGRNI